MLKKYTKITNIDMIGRETTSYLDNETGDYFPESLLNRHYVEYLAWIDEGNSPTIQNNPAPVCEIPK